MEEMELDGGNKVVWIVKKLVGVTLLICLLIVAAELTVQVLSQLHINAIYIRYYSFGAVYLLFLLEVRDCWDIYHQSFVVVDGCLNDIDLWNITWVDYSKHRLYIDKYRIDFVPNARKLYKSLAVYYYNLTGEELP